MEVIKGIPVSPGVAIVSAVVLDTDDVRVPRRAVAVADLPEQHKRLDEAIAVARDEVDAQRSQVAEDLGPEPAKIFGFHLGMLQDQSLIQQMHDLVDQEQVTAEFAVSNTMRMIADTFMKQTSTLFRERVNDVWDLEQRLLGQLLGDLQQELDGVTGEVAVVAHDMTPSQTASLDKSKVKAMATDLGGRTSHTAIVARALGIPAVVGLETASRKVETGESVIIDGNRGLIIIAPDEQQLAEYQVYLERFQTFASEVGREAQLPAVTTDGVAIDLLANIEFASEVPDALAKGALGVGLFRTEFLFLSADHEPDEEEQYKTFVETIDALGGQTLTIRTLDLGADKLTRRQSLDPEPNPFLGCRSIRLCLQDLGLFKTHLRAILRASAHGPMKIMFPLVTNMMELRQTKMILTDVMEDLEEDGIPFDRNIKIGIMVEVPAAALMARTLAPEVDFFSIGTNDLIQYTLAVDRSNERVANLYSGAHPAVIGLIKEVIRAGKRREVEVSCCGEMAGDLDFVPLLLGMGLRKLSMTPQAIPEIKKLVRSVSIEQCEKIARRAASYDSDRQVLNYLREQTRKAMPEAFDGRAIV